MKHDWFILISLLEKNCSSVNTAAQPSVAPIPKNIMYQHTALEMWSELLSVHVEGGKRHQVKDRVTNWHISRWWRWTALIISVVGSNPRRHHFQAYLKCVNLVVILLLFSQSWILQQKPPWNRNHMGLFFHQYLWGSTTLSENGERRKVLRLNWQTQRGWSLLVCIGSRLKFTHSQKG